MSEQMKKSLKDVVDLPIIRRRVARDLEPLVAKYFMLGPSSLLTKNDNTATLSNEKKIDLISRVLEAKLYAESSPSLEAYNDPTTLEARFQTVVSRMNAHRPAKKRKGITAHTTSSSSSKNTPIDGSTLENSFKAVSSSLNDRNLSINKQRIDTPTTQKGYHELLRSHVGEALYNKIQSVSLELHLLRQAYSNWFDVMKDQIIMNHPAQEDLQQSRAEDMVPKVLQQLYFHNPLLRALGHLNVTTDTVHIKRVTGPNWQVLVQEAESIKNRIKDLNCVRAAPTFH